MPEYRSSASVEALVAISLDFTSSSGYVTTCVCRQRGAVLVSPPLAYAFVP